MRIFAREPALWLALVAALVQGVGLILDWSIDQQGAINAVAVAVLGAVTAFVVKDGISAAVLGGVQAVLNLVLAFGLKLDPHAQAAIMTLAAALVGMFVRTQVIAPSAPAPTPKGLA